MLSSYPAGRPAQVVWDHRLAHIPSRKKDIYINPSPTAFSSLNTTAVMPANAGACTLTAELYLEWTPSLCRGGEIHGVFSVRSCGDANAADDDDDDDGYLGPRAFQVEYRDPEDRVHRTPVVILDQGEVHTWAPVLTHRSGHCYLIIDGCSDFGVVHYVGNEYGGYHAPIDPIA